MKKQTKRTVSRVVGLLFLLFILGGNLVNNSDVLSFIKHKAQTLWHHADNITLSNAVKAGTLDEVPEWDGTTEYVVVNDNHPDFSAEDIERGKSETWIELSPLDALGRTGASYACINEAMTPKEERGPIGHIKPSGWHQAKYPGIIPEEPNYALNRGHQLAFCVSGLNSEEKNLFTETRQANLCQEEFELKTLDYIKRHKNNHVLYRATPIFNGAELMARGILLEAQSIEDTGIEFCVYIYNAQKYIEFNYMTGASHVTEEGKALLQE